MFGFISLFSNVCVCFRRIFLWSGLGAIVVVVCLVGVVCLYYYCAKLVLFPRRVVCVFDVFVSPVGYLISVSCALAFAHCVGMRAAGQL